MSPSCVSYGPNIQRRLWSSLDILTIRVGGCEYVGIQPSVEAMVSVVSVQIKISFKADKIFAHIFVRPRVVLEHHSEVVEILHCVSNYVDNSIMNLQV